MGGSWESCVIVLTMSSGSVGRRDTLPSPMSSTFGNVFDPTRRIFNDADL